MRQGGVTRLPKESKKRKRPWSDETRERYNKTIQERKIKAMQEYHLQRQPSVVVTPTVVGPTLKVVPPTDNQVYEDYCLMVLQRAFKAKYHLDIYILLKAFKDMYRL